MITGTKMTESTKLAFTFKAIGIICLLGAMSFEAERVYYLTAAYIAVSIGWFILAHQEYKRERE